MARDIDTTKMTEQSDMEWSEESYIVYCLIAGFTSDVPMSLQTQREGGKQKHWGKEEVLPGYDSAHPLIILALE